MLVGHAVCHRQAARLAGSVFADVGGTCTVCVMAAEWTWCDGDISKKNISLLHLQCNINNIRSFLIFNKFMPSARAINKYSVVHRYRDIEVDAAMCLRRRL